MTATHLPSSRDLDGFRAAQRLAYACAEAIHAELKPGVTEREVAARMKKWLADHGAVDCLHEPFVWFGERTAFRGLISLNALRGFNPAFFPSGKKLENGMPFILDCAPTLNGYTADIGYSGVLGQNKILDQLMDDLAAHRELILKMIRERQLMSHVSQAVDTLCAQQGVDARHHAYPFAVLAHRIEKLPAKTLTPKLSLGRFGLRSVLSLGRDAARGLKDGWSPVWASHLRSAHPPVPGLWAVEPHLGFRDVGAKFEELLVITENDAYWLDDDVPHVKRWIERGVIGSAIPARKKAAAATAIEATASKKETAKTAEKKAPATTKAATPKKEAAKKSPASAKPAAKKTVSSTDTVSRTKTASKKPAAAKKPASETPATKARAKKTPTKKPSATQTKKSEA